MESIRSASLELNIDPENGSFSIHPFDARFPRLEHIRLASKYTVAGVRGAGLSASWHPVEAAQDTFSTVEHGLCDRVSLEIPANRDGIAHTLTFGITREYPLVLWKVQLHNRGNRDMVVQRINLLDIDPAIGGKMILPLAARAAEQGFFSNGWQSWSPSRWYRGDGRMNISNLGRLQHPMIYNPGTPLPRDVGVFSSDMFAVVSDQMARTGYLVGFLSQKYHFGSILADLNRGTVKMWANGDEAVLKSGGAMETDWAVFSPLLLDHRDPLEAYLEAVARENHALVPDQTPVGWCSWYQYYTGVTAADVETNLEKVIDLQERLPVEVVQIDDGFETNVGDWFTFKPTFPDGVAPLAEKISREGLIPGLWLAPFIVHPSSRLYRDHPGWLLRDENGKPANAGFVWNRLNTALDLTVPEALEYACRVIRIAVEVWGFPYLKLDFLYAAALAGRYKDPSKTRAQVLRAGMEAIREAAGSETTLLGCGVPLGSMIGLVELMRIGPDVSGDWMPKFLKIGTFFKDEPSMPSARNSIVNILTRANLHHKWWVNDPDCLLVRPDSNLTLTEVQSLATTIGLTGGALLISDDLTRLPAERISIAEALIPIMEEPVKIIDLFDAEIPQRLRFDPVTNAGAWHVLAAFNWSDQPQDIEFKQRDYRLEDGDYLYREFWSGASGEWSTDSSLSFTAVPAHGCKLLAVRRHPGDRPLYLGSDLHISQGIEVDEWLEASDGVNITLRLPRSVSGYVHLYLPGKVRAAHVNGLPGEIMCLDGKIHRLAVEVEGFCHIQVQYIKE